MVLVMQCVAGEYWSGSGCAPVRKHAWPVREHVQRAANACMYVCIYIYIWLTGIVIEYLDCVLTIGLWRAVPWANLLGGRKNSMHSGG
jgi:hypothetical protein